MPRNPKVAFATARCVALLAVLVMPRAAWAANMDPTPERLATCHSTGAATLCTPNNVAWANLMSELGMAIAPTAFHAARTTGLGGFALSLETSFTHVNAGATAGGTQYWHEGTEGPVDPPRMTTP